MAHFSLQPTWSASDPISVLEEMGTLLLQLSGADQILIYFRRGDGQSMDPVKAIGSLSLQEKQRFWASELEEDAPGLLSSLRVEPHVWLNKETRQAVGLGQKPWLAFPLTTSEGLSGLALFGWAVGSQTEAGSTPLLRAVLRSVELALENARLNDLASQQAQQAQSLRDVNREILRKTDLRDVLPLIAEAALRLINAAGCRLRVNEGQGGETTMYSLGRTAELDGDARLQQTQVINLPGEEGQVLVVPLQTDGQVMGWMEIFQRGTLIRPADVEVAGVFAEQASIAIEHTRLYQRLQVTAVAEERARLARELHDSISQDLYAMTMLARAAQAHLKRGETAAVEEQLQDLRQSARSALGEMRLLIYELRSPLLESRGLAGVLEQRLASVEKRSGLSVDFSAPLTADLPHSVEEQFYHIAQEALNNTIKHAGASRVQVNLEQGERMVRMLIADDGCGFDPAIKTGGLGLRTMLERAEQIGAEIEINSRPESGTQIEVKVNYERDSDFTGRRSSAGAERHCRRALGGSGL